MKINEEMKRQNKSKREPIEKEDEKQRRKEKKKGRDGEIKNKK